jgi:hypothetical protein
MHSKLSLFLEVHSIIFQDFPLKAVFNNKKINTLQIFLSDIFKNRTLQSISKEYIFQCHISRCCRLTKILSGLISACSILVLFNSFRAKNNCCAYDLTAFMCNPISFPYFFKTSRKFILKNKQKIKTLKFSLNTYWKSIRLFIYTCSFILKFKYQQSMDTTTAF